MGFSLSRKAEEDLIAIYVIGRAEFGADQAERYHEGFARTFAFLAANPRAAREREELRQRPRAFRYKAHLIFYRIDGEDIFILRIRNGREDWLSAP